jgi:hypothetical protein
VSTVEILRAARALIDTPEKWTRGAAARDASGASLSIGQWPEAASFCIVGACHVATGIVGESGIEARRNACYAIGRAATGRDAWPASFNDNATHADVLAAFDKAIEAAA